MFPIENRMCLFYPFKCLIAAISRSHLVLLLRRDQSKTAVNVSLLDVYIEV